MRQALSEPEASKATWGILVVDQTTGQTLYQLHSTHFFTPASNAKLFTTALALHELGPNFRWLTMLETSGKIDASGTLDGNLVLVARGDPDLSNRVFPFGQTERFDGPPDKALEGLVNQLLAKGVKHIQGDVVVDDTYFTYNRYPPGWTIDDFTAPYGAPVSAVVINDNTMQVQVSPGRRPGEAPTIAVQPWPAIYHFINMADTGPRGTGSDLKLFRQPDSFNVRVEGQIAEGEPPQGLDIAIEQPARYAAALLKHVLIKRGITVSGGTRVLRLLPNQPPPPPVARQVLAVHASPTLAEDVRFTLKVSQNLHAECMLRTVAHVKTGVGSTKNGLEVEKEFLGQLGIENDVAFFDGSGVSHYDLVTPRAVVTLLRYAAKQSWGAIYKDSLPEAGHDGTLEFRMVRTAASGRIFAKTGTLFHIHSLSGYARTLRGRRLVFSILVNNIPPNAKFNPVIDQIANAMVEDLGGPPRRVVASRRLPRRVRPR